MHHHGINMDDEIVVFKGVVVQDLKIIQVGDYFKLAFDHYVVIWL